MCFFIFRIDMSDNLYTSTLQYLYNSAPSFQQVGGGAYKEGLHNTRVLDAHFGFPHQQYPTIHIAGTNGKGSCAHTLAAILQCSGLKVGLYTSPHLVDFRERIRVNGKMISKERVIEFVEKEKSFFEPLHPSFFELTTALAFSYFSEQKVDIAVIEVGLGGRLDCTNIITPLLSIVTNISLDHTQFLGTTLAEIAAEKAGIFKKEIPALVGEVLPETRPVFERVAQEAGAPLHFSEDSLEVLSSDIDEEGRRTYETKTFGKITGVLAGECQIRNTNTILSAIKQLHNHYPSICLTKEHVRQGFLDVCTLTGLLGRWQIIKKNPTVICDTGHNAGGWTYLGHQLRKVRPSSLQIVFGMVADKDVESVLRELPPTAHFHWTRASVQRAMNENVLAEKAASLGLSGNTYPCVKEAFSAALAAARKEKDGVVFVGGSTFIVADLLAFLNA